MGLEVEGSGTKRSGFESFVCLGYGGGGGFRVAEYRMSRMIERRAHDGIPQFCNQGRLSPELGVLGSA